MDSARLKELRYARVLTQQELATAAHISVRTVTALERGETTAHPRTIRALAKALGVRPQELVDGPHGRMERG